VARDVVRAVAALAGRRAVPLRLVLAIRAVGTGRDPLVPASRRTDARTLRSASLREILDGEELGYWGLGPRSIEELVRTVGTVRPTAVIECGSGISTIVLAWALRQLWGEGDTPRVLSIEQDAGHADWTRSRLGRAGLAGEVVVVVAPLAEVDVDGSPATCYGIPDHLIEAIGGRPADLLLVDGPAGGPGIRFGTLPLVRSYLADGAWFMLDDALRDGELGVGRRWSALPYVHVEGLRLIEKGLLVGRVRAR
jgi:hypothetical protein